MTGENLIIFGIVVLLLPLLSFVINIFFGKKIGNKSGIVATSILGLVLILSSIVFYFKVFTSFGSKIVHKNNILWEFSDKILQLKFTWIDQQSIQLKVGIGIDNLAAIMLVVVALISFLVHLFSIEYMAGDPRYSRYFAYLGLFTFSMNGIVLANNFLFMYVFWELVGISSYLLIGFWYEKKSASDAGKKAFLVNRVGDLGFFIGIMILYFSYGTLLFDDIFSAIAQGKLPFDSETVLTLAGIFVFCGAIGKSAQFPLHVWLPDAMEGPTPVSALIHAATMVAAGVYLTARVYAMFTASALSFIASIGAITAFLAATIALTQVDFKRVLAYSTVSQLGYMIMSLGVGAYTMGFFHLVTHAWFKAALFLGSGSVIHAMHHAAHHLGDHHTDPQDIRNMGGLRRTMPWTYRTFLFVTLAICGVPLTSGFLSKDGILAGTLAYAQLTGGWHWLIPIAGFASAGLTAFYMFRLLIISFHGEPKTDVAKHTKENNWIILLPLFVLSILSFWFFYSPNPLDAHQGWFPKAIVQPKSVVPDEHQWEFLLINGYQKSEVAPHSSQISHHYLNEFEEAMHHSHYPAMFLSLLIAGTGILFAFLFYQFKIFNPDTLANQFSFLYKLSFRKWYFDEIYNATVVAFTVGFSKVSALFDLKVIDGIVNGSAWITRHFGYFIGHFDNIVIDGLVNLIANATGFFGSIVRYLQTGRVQTYVAFAVTGLVLLIYFLL
ncbi:MAG: NADH-quinone oxidoreductase subunit L [Ignavibacteria bacterium]|nr:NADH-quinone oxidoreductase subunit L [Ignavibacteria bacterium]